MLFNLSTIFPVQTSLPLQTFGCFMVSQIKLTNFVPIIFLFGVYLWECIITYWDSANKTLGVLLDYSYHSVSGLFGFINFAIPVTPVFLTWIIPLASYLASFQSLMKHCCYQCIFLKSTNQAIPPYLNLCNNC